MVHHGGTQAPFLHLEDSADIAVQIAALTGGGQPEAVPFLYDFLITKPQYSTSEQRQALVRRIREALVKCVSIVGVCKPLEAIFGLIPHERPEDRDLSCSREDWQCDEANDHRGFKWQSALYKANQGAIDDQLSNHKYFDWLSKKITYGLYLSDQRILDAVDTEMVVLSAIMIQNLEKETAWHLRGTRRIGVSSQDVELVQQCVSDIQPKTTSHFLTAYR
jgi:hypothetical protein